MAPVVCKTEQHHPWSSQLANVHGHLCLRWIRVRCTLSKRRMLQVSSYANIVQCRGLSLNDRLQLYLFVFHALRLFIAGIIYSSVSRFNFYKIHELCIGRMNVERSETVVNELYSISPLNFLSVSIMFLKSNTSYAACA